MLVLACSLLALPFTILIPNMPSFYKIDKEYVDIWFLAIGYLFLIIGLSLLGSCIFTWIIERNRNTGKISITFPHLPYRMINFKSSINILLTIFSIINLNDLCFLILYIIFKSLMNYFIYYYRPGNYQLDENLDLISITIIGSLGIVINYIIRSNFSKVKFFSLIFAGALIITGLIYFFIMSNIV